MTLLFLFPNLPVELFLDACSSALVVMTCAMWKLMILNHSNFLLVLEECFCFYPFTA